MYGITQWLHTAPHPLLFPEQSATLHLSLALVKMLLQPAAASGMRAGWQTAQHLMLIPYKVPNAALYIPVAIGQGTSHAHSMHIPVVCSTLATVNRPTWLIEMQDCAYLSTQYDLISPLPPCRLIGYTAIFISEFTAGGGCIVTETSELLLWKLWATAHQMITTHLSRHSEFQTDLGLLQWRQPDLSYEMEVVNWIVQEQLAISIHLSPDKLCICSLYCK